MNVSAVDQRRVSRAAFSLRCMDVVRTARGIHGGRRLGEPYWEGGKDRAMSSEQLQRWSSIADCGMLPGVYFSRNSFLAAVILRHVVM